MFLILIAVALFAALSYAVSSSTRSESGVGDTTDVIDASEVNQFPTGVHFSVMRMKIGGVDETDMEFNYPADFANLSQNEHGIFHPEGGGVTYQAGSANLMANGAQGTWFFNAEFEIEELGLDVASSFDGNEMIAFLPGINPGACREINEKGDIGQVIPNTTTDFSGRYSLNMDNLYVIPSDEAVIGASAGNGTDDLTGKMFGCFQNNGGAYVYYQVIKIR